MNADRSSRKPAQHFQTHNAPVQGVDRHSAGRAQVHVSQPQHQVGSFENNAAHVLLGVQPIVSCDVLNVGGQIGSLSPHTLGVLVQCLVCPPAEG